MRDSPSLVQSVPVLEPAALKVASGTGHPSRSAASEQDLLVYMVDLLAELQTLANKARFKGLADLLGYAHREAERNRKAR